MVDRFGGFPEVEESRLAIVRLGMRASSAYMAQGIYTTMKTTVRRLANGTLRSVVNGKAAQTSFGASFGMSDMSALITGDVMAVMSPNVARMAELFGNTLGSSVNRKVGLLPIHQQVALAAQQAVQEAYQKLVQGRGGADKELPKVPSYREGQGRLPGKMGEALARPDFNQATIDGIFFANVAMLDQVAAHWRRLNFGAGARGRNRTESASAFNVKFFNEPIGTLQINFGPSPAFVLPPGLFVRGTTAYGRDPDRRGMDQFYLFGMEEGLGITKRNGPFPTDPIVTKGIVGRRFLDAGIGVLANTLPYLYEQKVREWLDLASKETGRRGPFGPMLEQAEAVALRDSAIATRHANQFLHI